MRKIKSIILKWLGITYLEQENRRLLYETKFLRERIQTIDRWLLKVNNDNGVILDHVKFLNSQFFVAADIHPPRHPSVVLVMHKGGEHEIKSYYFNDKTVTEIYRFIEGFGKNNVVIDTPYRGFPGPKYRY